MGCDIHCYIEHKPAGSDRWEGFGGRINPGRCYLMFGVMAGVRVKNVKFIKPRGMPSDAACDADRDYWLFITDTEGEGYVTKERAKKYIKEYGSKWGAEKAWVSNPDWHSHSWLNATELRYCIDRFDKESAKQSYGRCPIEYRAILSVLDFFEEQGENARLVFWFDN